MTEQQIRSKVREILSTVLKRAVSADEEVTRKLEEHWDSLRQVEIIFSLEETFNIQFSEEEMATLNSLTKIVEVIKLHHEA